MTNDELKKKIVEILCKVWIEPVPCTAERKFEHAADALIAAGIGDVTEWKEKAKKHRVQVLPDGTIKQLYSDEEVEDIARQRDEYKHRAEVAENELKLYKLAVKIWQERYSDIRCFNFNIALKQAEKELAEKRKDG